MNLQQLRDYVRMQLDMDEEELPNPTLDAYFQEGFERTIAADQRWPFYEVDMTVVIPAGARQVEIPAGLDAQQLASVITPNGLRLIQISNEQAEQNALSLATSTTPIYYSIWANSLRFWPVMQSAQTVYLRGYRKPEAWITQGAGAIPDCDERLHFWIAHYAIALCYAQQEDEVLEATYMQRWSSGVQLARSSIVSPRHHRPLILNGGLPIVSSPNTAVAWANPPVSP